MRLSPTKRWVLYALVVWLGGLGCLAGCVAETYAAPAHEEHARASAISPAEENCTDGCCKKSGDDSQPGPQPVQQADCCLYLTTPPATVAKKSAVTVPSVVIGMVAAPASLLAATEPFAGALPSLLLDSGGTYLRNRVLRI